MNRVDMNRIVIETVGLRKSYGDNVAVDGLDLTIRQGEIVAVLGPNGAGKTTTIEMLLGLRRPSGGSVEIFGMSAEDSRTRARVGAMLQDSDAPEAMTVAEIIDLVRHYYPYALPVEDALSRADLSAHRHKRASELSGGLRQRLSFAIALVGDPDLIYLDEPTASLDVEARRAFWEQVRTYADSGRTIVFTTHNLAEAESLATRVVVIVGGRIVADGTPAQITASVGGSLVRLRTEATAAWLRARTGVAAVVSDGHSIFEVRTSEPEHLLHELFRHELGVADLRVTDASLETAFVHLVGS